MVPSGVLLRTYSHLMFGPWRVPYLDMLYFWPSNVDPRVGRAMMRRNFSNISVGVIRQVGRRHTVNHDCVCLQDILQWVCTCAGGVSVAPASSAVEF